MRQQPGGNRGQQGAAGGSLAGRGNPALLHGQREAAACLVCLDLYARPHRAHSLGRHQRLALPHVPLAEEELAIEVAGLDCVHVNLQGIKLKKSQG